VDVPEQTVAVALAGLAGWPFLPVALAHRADGSPSPDESFRAKRLAHPGIAVNGLTIGADPAVDASHLVQTEGLLIRWCQSNFRHARPSKTLRPTSEAPHLRVLVNAQKRSPSSLHSPLNLSETLKQPQISAQSGSLLAGIAGALAPGWLAPPAALLASIKTGATRATAPFTHAAQFGVQAS
jgi:hypothetical protein